MPKKEFIFLSLASKYRLGADKIKPEVRFPNGLIREGTGVIEFEDNVYRTSSLSEAKYMREAENYGALFFEVSENALREFSNEKQRIVKIAQSSDGTVSGDIIKGMVKKVIAKHGHGSDDSKKKDIEPDPVVEVSDPGTT